MMEKRGKRIISYLALTGEVCLRFSFQGLQLFPSNVIITYGGIQGTLGLQDQIESNLGVREGVILKFCFLRILRGGIGGP